MVLPGNRYPEEDPRFFCKKIGERASGSALPGRAGKRVEKQLCRSDGSYAQTFSSDIIMPVKEPPSKAKVAKVLIPNPAALFSAA